MGSSQIRRTFIDYFKKNGHTEVSSSSLVPENDATLLFANAGMNQFKNSFLGIEDRGYKRAVTSQKCVRAGGKHNDLENVGFTARHHTFFEMLGNFSFGDYFKKDAIRFAWDLLTKELQIPKDRLYVTVFQDDDEAAEIWHNQEGVPRDRIYRFGEKDNFWRMGDVGPCGPSSEIFYDHGPEADLDPSRPSKMGDDGDRFVEIWNLVFMQFYEDGKGGREKLPKPSVDTGGGLERWSSVIAGKPVNYDTDLFQPIIQKAAEVSKKDYASDLRILDKNPELKASTSAMRVLADHSRATAFLIADGVLPSNEGRGYVLRRIMRRAIRFARQLSDDPQLMVLTVGVVISEMGPAYPELSRNSELILGAVRDEVTRFTATLVQGTEILNSSLKNIGAHKTLGGDLVFKLYDTYGFPVDLTRLIATEHGYKIDEAGFEKLMNEARERAKSSSKFKSLSSDQAHLIQLTNQLKSKSGPTKFLGYIQLEAHGEVLAISDGHKEVPMLAPGQSGLMILNQTPVYAESGGQAGDQAKIQSAGLTASVTDCTKLNDIHIHHVHVDQGQIKVGDKISIATEESIRKSTASNHSATHLMHAALRKVLGTHVTQAGSLVDAERLRFDFTHNKPMTAHEIEEIELLVNQEISSAHSVGVGEMSHKEALAQGALALFGEKYGDRVRVIKMGGFSCELCGGTHVQNTSVIRVFKIVSEGGVSSGVRRIEAITGERAVKYLLRNTFENQEVRIHLGIHESWQKQLEPQAVNPTLSWIETSKKTLKDLEKELKAAKGASVNVESFVQKAKSFTKDGMSFRYATVDVEIDDRQVLAELCEKVRAKLNPAVVVVIGRGEGSHPVVVSVSKELSTKVPAGKILAEVAGALGGKGGGRPEFANGAAPNRENLPLAFAAAEKLF